MQKIKLITILIGMFLFTTFVFAQNTSDYLILQDIGLYKLDKPEKSIPGFGLMGGPRIDQNSAGVLSGAGHFPDHKDITYSVMYLGGGANPSPEVEVTLHAGGDSDRWLLHEIEDNYRDDEIETLGLLTDGAVMRRILLNGVYKRVLWIGIGGGSFTWLSNNVVIKISYTDLQGTKPEPIEVVNAYLQKFPSTINITDADFKSNNHNVQWIKDEIDRRLWLCDKWNAQFQAGGVTQADMIYNLVRSMKVFLNYRQKYFNVSAQADLDLLSGYQQNKDIASLQTKLSEYKGWWNSNKAKAISLPLEKCRRQSLELQRRQKGERKVASSEEQERNRPLSFR